MANKAKAFLTGSVFGALLLAAAACGSDGDDAAGLSKTDFLAQGNELCSAADGRIEVIARTAFGEGEPTPDKLQTALDGIVAESRALLTSLDGLAAPSDLADQMDEMLTEFGRANDEAEAQGLAFFESDDDPWAEANAMATTMGLTACGGEGTE